MFKHLFGWKYQYNKYMLNFIDIYSFIHVSVCVGRGPSALLCPGVYNTAKTDGPDCCQKFEHFLYILNSSTQNFRAWPLKCHLEIVTMLNFVPACCVEFVFIYAF